LFRVDSMPQARDILRAQGSERGLVVQGGLDDWRMERLTAE